MGERDAITAEIKSFAEAATHAESPDAESVARVAATVERYHGVEVTLERARECTLRAHVEIEPFVHRTAWAMGLLLSSTIP